jgi:hypothetical protein
MDVSLGLEAAPSYHLVTTLLPSQSSVSSHSLALLLPAAPSCTVIFPPFHPWLPPVARRTCRAQGLVNHIPFRLPLDHLHRLNTKERE